MSKSKKTIAEMDWQTCSCMRWGSGEEVNAYLDWDSSKFYLWFEPTYNFESWCEESGEDEMMDMLRELEEELDKIGVQEFYDLKSVNEYCKRQCGSDDPYDCAEFYYDEYDGVSGT